MPTVKARAPYTILPLGDSITCGLVSGGQSPGGYRLNLARLLTQTSSPLIGKPLRFWGLQGTGSGISGGNTSGRSSQWARHGGIGGQRIHEIQARVDAELAAANPAIVLLHAGTNDIVTDYLLSTAPDRLATLVQSCLDYPGVQRVLVCDLINFRSTATTFNTRAASFRSALPSALAAQLADTRCRLAGGSTSFSSLLLDSEFHTSDDVHPSITAGYDKLGEAMYNFINANGPY